MVKSIRRCKPVLRIKPHIMFLWKETVAGAFFNRFGVARDQLTAAQSAELLEDEGYMTSELGYPSLINGVENLLLLVNTGVRVQQPENVADVKVMSCTTGHIALAAAFIRMILVEVKAGKRACHGGSSQRLRRGAASGG